jgi:hypothetical protein
MLSIVWVSRDIYCHQVFNGESRGIVNIRRKAKGTERIIRLYE